MNIGVCLRNIIEIIASDLKKIPQYNRVTETMNRIICERIRYMLYHAKLPKFFWGEAMRTIVDLINLSSSAPLQGDVPERIWFWERYFT